MTDLWKFHGGIKLEGHKTLSSEKPITQAKIPQFLVLPLLQHKGEPADPIVKVGDYVYKGQIIAHCHANNCNLYASSPIHASSSGTIIAIEARNIPHPSGLKVDCIIIETDGKDQWQDLKPISDYTNLSANEVRTHIAKAGIVGLGGAGFPTQIKLNARKINTLIINGAECEPYITCDDRLMRERAKEIVHGAEIISYILGGVKRRIIAVEDNKPEAYQALLTASANSTVEIIQVPTIYPMGGEIQLIEVLTGNKISRSTIPASIGIVVQNVETASAVYRAIEYGEPLLSRIVTITGNGVKQPQNMQVLLGTPMSFLLEQCQVTNTINRLIMGGSMMGLSLPNDDIPIIKTTNCLIASEENEIATATMPCIRCGSCEQVCPIDLLPQQLYWFTKAKDFEKLEDYKLFDCIECGACAYVCPSNIPLVGYYHYAKSELRSNQNERKKSDLARQRHDFRIFRLEREKKERAERHKKAAKKSKSAIKEEIAKARAEKG
jgi:electron transport complex protein RnfC